MSDETSVAEIVQLLLYVLPLAMGVATIVLPLLTPGTDISMVVGIAIFCLAIAGLNKR